ncbi:MAG: cation transporter [Clostridia bacterium]|nr:cation transporter [Clostridia bacterium]
MITLIKKLFIKDYKNTRDASVRFRYGVVAGIFGLISNLLLFASKLIVGLIGASITIVADAVNNLADMGSNCVVIFGFKLSSKPADSEHPFGHARYEQIMALIVAVLVVSIGLLLGKSSIEKIISNDKTSVSIATYIVLGSAILIKIFQAVLYNNFSKSINSQVLKASSIDSRNDVISTTAVLVATILIHIFGDVGISIDGLFGILVSIFIIISSLKLVKETIGPLLGEMPEKDFIDELKKKLLSYKGILGIHDFLIHSYGPNTYFASVHAEVSNKVDVMISHDMIDNIEKDFKDIYNISLSIHMDPIENENEEVNFHKQKVKVILDNFDKSLDFHDFRLVSGETHTNLIFDVVIPFASKITVEDIKAELYDKYKKEEKTFYFVINVDRI